MFVCADPTLVGTRGVKVKLERFAEVVDFVNWDVFWANSKRQMKADAEDELE